LMEPVYRLGVPVLSTATASEVLSLLGEAP
jgi:hypothetical protein